MSELKEDVEKLAQKEMRSINQNLQTFGSNYESAAIIRAKIDKVEEEMNSIDQIFEQLWYEVKANEDDTERWLRRLHNVTISLGCAAIQLATTTQKIIESRGKRET